MIIVIDAYNLLHVMPFYKKTLTDEQRVTFIKRLGVYGKRKGHKIVVVFDGGQSEWPIKEKIYSVYCVYSGINASADDYIKEYLEAHRSKEVLLVSSDLELIGCAHRFSIPSIDSVGFYSLLQEALRDTHFPSKSEGTVVKMTQDTNDAIDSLMNEVRVTSQKAEDFSVDSMNNCSSKKKQLNKYDRVLLKKLYKL